MTIQKKKNILYNQSHIKSDQPGSRVFRWFLSPFSTDFHEILQTLFFKRIPTALKISQNDIHVHIHIAYFKS